MTSIRNLAPLRNEPHFSASASRIALLGGLLLVSLPGCGANGSPPTGETAMTLQLTSPAFENGSDIPRKHTCDGADVSPALNWSAPPAGARSFCLIMDDPDAPGGTWVHWVLYNLRAETRSLPEGVPKEKELADGARQGRNDFARPGYGGPCPPRGPAHRYYLKLYALDASLNLQPGASKADLEKAMGKHILAQGQLIGRYKR